MFDEVAVQLTSIAESLATIVAYIRIVSFIAFVYIGFVATTSILTTFFLWRSKKLEVTNEIS